MKGYVFIIPIEENGKLTIENVSKFFEVMKNKELYPMLLVDNRQFERLEEFFNADERFELPSLWDNGVRHLMADISRLSIDKI